MLTIKNLSVTLDGRRLLSDLSCGLGAGETLCVVGESGCGKTTFLRSVQGLLPARIERFRYEPRAHKALDHPPLNQRGLPGARWVMQDPLAALNPRLPIGVSIGESLYDRGLSEAERRRAVCDALAAVELEDRFYHRLPGQVSLGQAQRACLARALVAEPELILFDEPLSALDAVVQKQIAATMRRLQQERGLAYIIVTHDLGFAAAYADHILLLHEGEQVAFQPADQFFQKPESPLAQELIAAARALGGLAAEARP